MNRSLFILIGVLALATAIFAGSYFATQRTCLMCSTQPADALEWLRLEFHLNDAEMARIRQLHAGYLPKCAELCAKIAAKKSELAAVLRSGTNLDTAAQAKLSELAGLRAKCQAQMLQYFATVSQAMPPAQGQRYLAEMQRLTLGTGEAMEQSMTNDPGHEHHH
jgi:hypothetical protein